MYIKQFVLAYLAQKSESVKSCRIQKWPRITENGLPYTIDMVGYLTPYVVYGEIATNPLTNYSEIRVKEVLKHVDAIGIDEVIFQERKGFSQPQKITLNCQVKKSTWPAG